MTTKLEVVDENFDNRLKSFKGPIISRHPNRLSAYQEVIRSCWLEDK
jgi:hypothetical protein